MSDQCVSCGRPVDTTRGTRSQAGTWAHQTCVRMWAAFIDGEPIALRIGTEAGYVNMLTQPVEGGDR